MLKQSIGMTENNAKQIAEMYLSHDIRADDIFWFRQTMLQMIVYNTKHEPSTEHEDIAIIDGILFGRY